MIRWILGIAGIVVVLGLYFALRYGIAPRPVPLIKATEVKNLEQAGVLVYRRMRQEIRANKIVLAGSLPMIPSYQDFWQGFVLGAQNDGAPIDTVIYVAGMNPFLEMKAIKTNEIDAGGVFQASLSGGFTERVLLYLPLTLVTHLNSKSLSKQMDKEKKKKISISLHSFPVDEASLSKIQKLCPAGKEASLLSQLDCLAAKVTQNHYRRKPDPRKNLITLYRYGLSDYLAFWHQAVIEPAPLIDK